MTTYFPANHRHAERESRIISGLSRTWNAIAPDTGHLSQRELHGFLLDCYVEMYGGLAKDDLDAWHELCAAPVGSKDYKLAVKVSKAVVS